MASNGDTAGMRNEPKCRHCEHCEPYSFILGKHWQTENHCKQRVVSFPEPCPLFSRAPGSDDEIGS
jgi:hypothetical protein